MIFDHIYQLTLSKGLFLAAGFHAENWKAAKMILFPLHRGGIKKKGGPGAAAPGEKMTNPPSKT